jgi:hypothetical protein
MASSLSVRPLNIQDFLWNYKKLSDFTGKFDTVGIAEGFINPKLFPIKELRLNIHSESDNWVILNEVRVIFGGTINSHQFFMNKSNIGQLNIFSTIFSL